MSYSAYVGFPCRVLTLYVVQVTAVEERVQQVLIEDRGGPNRVRILSAVDKRPRNANRLAKDLDLDYKTVNHHLDVLMESRLLRCSGDDYGAVYLLNDQTRHYWETVKTIVDSV